MLPTYDSEEVEEYMAERTGSAGIHIHELDSDSLLQIFSHYRLKYEGNWKRRHTWRSLAHVCQRWRYLMFDMWSHLDMSLVLTINSPSINTLLHLPPIPLFIYSPDHGKGAMSVMSRKDEENIRFGLQWVDRVVQVYLRARPSSLRRCLGQMNQLFPRLGDLSLLSTSTEENLVLPETFQAPDLRRLALHGIGLSTRSTLKLSAISLSTLSLTHIGASSYLSPGHLVKQLQGLPYLEKLSIGFAIPIPLPSTEGKLLPAPMPPVTLPFLRRLTFRGVGVYLDNLVAQITAPLLERLDLTLLFELNFTLVNLTEFIRRTEGYASGCPDFRVKFKKDGVYVDAGHKKSSYHEPWRIKTLSVRVNCEPLDWQMDTALQVCRALGKVVSTVEVLSLDLDVDAMPLDWENMLEDMQDDMLWHYLLLSFTGVKRLYIGSSLTFELSRTLESVIRDPVVDFLPELRELEVTVRVDQATNIYPMFLSAREILGRPVHLLVDEVTRKGDAIRKTKAAVAALAPPRSLPVQRPTEARA